MINRNNGLIKFLLLTTLFFNSLVYAATNRNIILFIWDGLRPDSISPQITPNLYKLAQNGTFFNDNHSSYPTFTMINASSFATGDLAGKTGFYGNVLWNNRTRGLNAYGKPVDFQQPVFTEDYQILLDLNKHEPLTEAYTLLDQASSQGIQTAAVGKSGPAFFQAYKNKGIIFDEMHVFPLNFANYLKSISYPIPANTVYSYPNFILNKNNGSPTLTDNVINMKDGVTSDPTIGTKSPYNKSNTYLMDSYITQIAPKYNPQLSVIWLRNPDTTEHNYGVGSPAYYDALSNQDNLLGRLISHLKNTKQWDSTDLIVASDHSHSNVSADLQQFPLRTIRNGEASDIDNINGYSVSGDFRPADLLTRTGFKAFDGLGCEYDPTLGGITKNNQPVYPTLYDNDGKVCGGIIKIIDKNGHRNTKLGSMYNTPSYVVPKKLPVDAIIVANNGGSTYFYVPNHNKELVKRLVRFCQSRQEFGAIFIDSRYGDLPGTISLSMVKLQNDQSRNPDLIVSSSYDDKQRIQGFPGTEFNSAGTSRGMHGSFSPIDVHNTLIAYGPDFKQRYVDQLPSGNIDVAPTIAYLLGIPFKNTDGRVLMEALSSTPRGNSYNIVVTTYNSAQPATHIVYQLATSPEDRDIDTSVSNYDVVLHTKTIQQNGRDYTYFDSANAIRY